MVSCAQLCCLHCPPRCTNTNSYLPALEITYVKSICVLLLTGCFRSGIANGELLDPHLCFCFGSRLTYYFIIRHFPVFFDMVEKGVWFYPNLRRHMCNPGILELLVCDWKRHTRVLTSEKVHSWAQLT